MTDCMYVTACKESADFCQKFREIEVLQVHEILLRVRPSQKMKKLSDQKYLLTTFIGSHKILKNPN